MRASRAHVLSRLTLSMCMMPVARAVTVDVHPIGIILKSNTIKGVRFTVSKEHWKGSTAVYNRLPENVMGEITSWGGRSKDDNKINVEWVTDGTNSAEFLAVLLRRPLGFKLLPYENGKSAPKAKGASAKRRYATAMANGPYAPARDGGDGPEGQKVEVRSLPATRTRSSALVIARTRDQWMECGIRSSWICNI